MGIMINKSVSSHLQQHLRAPASAFPGMVWHRQHQRSAYWHDQRASRQYQTPNRTNGFEHTQNRPHLFGFLTVIRLFGGLCWSSAVLGILSISFVSLHCTWWIESVKSCEIPIEMALVWSTPPQSNGFRASPGCFVQGQPARSQVNWNLSKGHNYAW